MGNFYPLHWFAFYRVISTALDSTLSLSLLSHTYLLHPPSKWQTQIKFSIIKQCNLLHNFYSCLLNFQFIEFNAFPIKLCMNVKVFCNSTGISWSKFLVKCGEILAMNLLLLSLWQIEFIRRKLSTAIDKLLQILGAQTRVKIFEWFMLLLLLRSE